MLKRSLIISLLSNYIFDKSILTYRFDHAIFATCGIFVVNFLKIAHFKKIVETWKKYGSAFTRKIVWASAFVSNLVRPQTISELSALILFPQVLNRFQRWLLENFDLLACLFTPAPLLFNRRWLNVGLFWFRLENRKKCSKNDKEVLE